MYTSWGKRGQLTPLYLGPDLEVLGEFGEERATVDGRPWALVRTDTGASVYVDGEPNPSFSIAGKLSRDKRLEVTARGRSYSFINEARSDWIIEEPDGTVAAQFSGGNNGVRKAILEVRDGDFERDDLAALSWFVRLILESKLNASSTILTITLVAATLVAILAFTL